MRMPRAHRCPRSRVEGVCASPARVAARSPGSERSRSGKNMRHLGIRVQRGRQEGGGHPPLHSPGGPLIPLRWPARTLGFIGLDRNRRGSLSSRGIRSHLALQDPPRGSSKSDPASARPSRGPGALDGGGTPSSTPVAARAHCEGGVSAGQARGMPGQEIRCRHHCFCRPWGPPAGPGRRPAAWVIDRLRRLPEWGRGKS